MATPAQLAAFLASLRASDRVTPLAEDDDSEAVRLRLINAEPGQIIAVDEETYWEFLEVLPPRWQAGGQFCFAEGSEAFIYFWRTGEEHFARRLTDEETDTVCRLAPASRDL
ncbi:hypothetical protein [Tautonia sociabilis]|uniref:Uncharacterized protein n=1 Tax=Tautonia sociabilis TaxID=2080755 RepID=A0A432MF58_9BACT|nr:hypothetical protein [Tautonia sociabilis]RUL84589.1 hypothetical protein TsocGM_20145 [Tautonia sociabilis]